MTSTYHPEVFISNEEVAAAGGWATEVLRRDYHDCPTCGCSVRNDDTTTVCDPKHVRMLDAWKRKQAKKAAIYKRMEERKTKFNAAQARDEYAIYLIDHNK
jgi:hypothetical protein